MSEQNIRNNSTGLPEDYSNIGRQVPQRPLTSYERDKAAREAAAAANGTHVTPGRSRSSSSRTSSKNTATTRSSRSKKSLDFLSKKPREEKPKEERPSKLFKQRSGFLPLFMFPAAIVWLEFILHLFMGMQIKYAPIWILHGIFHGAVFTVITQIFPKKASLIISKVAACICSIAFCIEYVAKNILQDFYPISMAKTGLDNHLTDYIGAIIKMIVGRFYVILLFLVPAILIIILYNRNYRARIKKRGIIILSVFFAVVFFLLGMLAISINWKGNISPKELYKSDTNYDDQVEQLGLVNFLRLDIKHMIWPVESSIDVPVGPTDPIGDDPEPTDPSIDTSPNIINIDFDKVLSSTSNNNIKNLAKYFKTASPTKKNEYTGMFKDYNVVFITVEGLSGYVINPELTPTLYKITHEGFVFNNFYTALHFTSTSNGECQNLLGLYPKNGFPITMSRTGELKTNTYFSLARQLGRLGYANYGYHNNVNMYNRESSHTNLGYTWSYIKYNSAYQKLKNCMDWEGGKGLNSGKLRWPQRDSFMIEHTVDDYINGDKPFNVYYLTISGHTPYTLGSWAFNEWRDTVNQLKYSENTRAYIASYMELDKAVAVLMEKLQAAGKLDKTLIVMAPDHIPYFDVDVLEELTGKKFGSSTDLQAINERNIDFEVYHSAMAIWTPSMSDKKVEINKVCCQVDILPTISNLLGLEYDSRMLSGTDILSRSEGLVVFSSKSWKSDRGFYNSFTKKFTPNEGVKMDSATQDAYVKYMDALAKNRLSITPMIVESNFYNYVLSSDKFISSSSFLNLPSKAEQQKFYKEEVPMKSFKEFKENVKLEELNKSVLEL